MDSCVQPVCLDRDGCWDWFCGGVVAVVALLEDRNLAVTTTAPLRHTAGHETHMWPLLWPHACLCSAHSCRPTQLLHMGRFRPGLHTQPLCARC